MGSIGRKSWNWLRRKSYNLLDNAEAMADVSDAEDGGGGREVNIVDVASNIQEPEAGSAISSQIDSVKSELAVESPRQQVSPVLSASPDDTSSQGLECPICLQPCVHPVELPCRHIFCFLCIKGVAMQGPQARCAICRSPIPHNVLTHPRLKDVSQMYKHVHTTSGFEWYYEARGGGWWQYDERSIQELEKAFEAGQTSCQLLIAGHLYEMDFAQMIQYRLNNRNLFRRMKRDVASAEKRGIAGIRLNQGRGGGGDSSGNNADGSGPTDSGRRGRGRHGPSSQQRPASQGQNDNLQSQPPSRPSTASGNNVIVLSESDSDNERQTNGTEDADSDDPEYLEEEEDMDLGEEDELGESVDEEEEAEDELRDGARAPTRRSDRSNSSTNPTPPPNGIVNGSSRNHNSSPNSNPNGRASRGARSDRSNAGSKSNNTDTSSTANGSGGSGGRNSQGVVEPSSSTSSPSPQFLIEKEIRTISVSNIRISSAPVATDLPPNLSLGNVGANNNDGSSRTSSSSITTTSGLTCLLVGPGVRITVDQDNPNRDDVL